VQCHDVLRYFEMFTIASLAVGVARRAVYSVSSFLLES
jgi:hypothetical protein